MIRFAPVYVQEDKACSSISRWITLIFPRRRIAMGTIVSDIHLDTSNSRLKLDELTIDTSHNYTRMSALLQNIAYLSQAIQQLQVASISYINFAGLVSVGALTVGIISPVPLVETFAPYALSIIFIFLIQLYTDIERLITIREVFEAHANNQMLEPGFLGLNSLSSAYRGRLSVRLVAGLLALPLLLFGYYSINPKTKPQKSSGPLKHVHHHHLWAEVGHHANYFGLFFCAVVILRALWEMFFAHKKALLEVKETLGDPPQAVCDRSDSAKPDTPRVDHSSETKSQD